VAQCGFCQPGMIMEAAALLAKHPRPTDADIDATMSHHVCRCGTYQRIRQAIHRAAEVQPAKSGAKPNSGAKP
jgi:aerobic-type carbon monoxide dehydrogenase small subunit (CoxS/CutS family)